MSAVMTPNGTEVILCPRDLTDIVRRYCGDDIANIVSNKIADVEETELYVEKKFNSDFRSLEGQVEEYHNIMTESEEALNRVLNYIEDKQRINRDKVYIMVQNIMEYIHKNI